MDLNLSHWISHKCLLLILLLIDSWWNYSIQIISKLSSVVSRSSASVYQVSLWLIAPKIFRQVWESSCQKTLAYVRYFTLWHYRLSMYFSSHASLLVYLIACAFGLLCFICCFLVKLYILFNHLISTVLPSWWWIKMYIFKFKK